MIEHAFRLGSGQLLREEIDKYVEQHQVQAGVILTGVGNLKRAVLRMADSTTIKTYNGSFEIVSMVGTLEAGNSHIHMSIADEEGKVFGGHLRPGSIVGTTAELAIGELETKIFKRKFDPKTGFEELIIEEKI